MKLMTITVEVAYHDCQERTVDEVASKLTRYLCDGLEAEVAYTSRRAERTVSYPDPDFDNAAIDEGELWQQRAREEMPESHD